MKLINLLIIALSVASNPAAAAADENNNKATVATNLLRGTFNSAFHNIMTSNGIYEEEEEEEKGCQGSYCCPRDFPRCGDSTPPICCGEVWKCASCCDPDGCPTTAEGDVDVEEVEEDVADRPPALIAANSS